MSNPAAWVEVNTSVATLDGITQQNASMVEQTNDQMRKLSDHANALKSLLAGLRTGDAPISNAATGMKIEPRVVAFGGGPE